MEIRQQADVVDTRIIFGAYSVLVALTGLVLLGWSQRWIGPDLAGQPWNKAVPIRILGCILMAVACFTAAFVGVHDPLARRRGLLGLGAGHAVVFAAALIGRDATWGPRPADWVLETLFAATALLLYFGLTAFGDPTGDPPASPLVSLFGGATASAGPLRSRYEQQIREAAGQEERNRLARELHDSVKQQIFVIQTAAATAQARFEGDADGAKQALNEVRNAARDAMAEMEVMLDQLRAAPLENVGLIESLKTQCEALSFRTGARVRFEPGKLPRGEWLVPGAQQAIFRVAQEGLANVARHARATSVLVTLDAASGQIRLRIQDDGAGFDPNQGAHGMGVANMRERAKEFGGILDFSSRPGAGTSLSFSIPYAAPEPERYWRKVKIWAAVLVFPLLGAILTRNRFLIGLDVATAIILLRELIAYRRARKESEPVS